MPFISHLKDDRKTSKATDRSLEGPSVVIEFIFYIVPDIFKTQKTAKPSTWPASIIITPTPTTPKEKEATESMGPERREVAMEHS